jgi:hypothetical protein
MNGVAATPSSHRYKTWAEAAGLPETAAKLNNLPSEVHFPDDFPEPIRFDPVRKLLVYRGFMSSTSYRFLHGLSADRAFMEALDGLFMGTSYADTGGTRVWPWVLAGTASLVGSVGLAWMLLFGK